MTETRPAVVVGLDGSDAARAALDWALETAHLRALPVHILHTWSVPLPPVALGPAVSGPSEDALREAAQTLLDEAVAHAHAVAPDVEVVAALRTAAPAGALIDASAGAEVVVVGSRGLGTFAELLVGSVSVQVATHAQSPVAVVRPREVGEPTGPDAGRIVVGVDGSELSLAAAQRAYEEASLRGREVTVLHAWEAPFFDAPGTSLDVERITQDIQDEQQELMLESTAGLSERYPDVPVEHRLALGSGQQVLTDASRGAELLVVGSRGRGGFASLMLGSVSHAVLHHAACPVLIVRQGTS